MKINNKKSLIVIFAVIVIIILAFAGKNLCEIINTNIQINNTEEKLKKIDCDNLEKELIAELKGREINLNKTFYGKDLVLNLLDYKNVEKNNIYTFDTEISKVSSGWICATTTCKENNNIIGTMQIPCFKIEKDSEGNFKNIKFFTGYYNPIDSNYIKEKFKTSYDIDFELFGWNNYNGKYINHFCHHSSEKVEIEVDNDKVFEICMEAMTEKHWVGNKIGIIGGYLGLN